MDKDSIDLKLRMLKEVLESAINIAEEIVEEAEDIDNIRRHLKEFTIVNLRSLANNPDRIGSIVYLRRELEEWKL